MGLGRSLKKAYRKVTHNKIYDREKLRRHLGLSSKSKIWRQTKSHFFRPKMSNGMTSASDLAAASAYNYVPRPISSLM